MLIFAAAYGLHSPVLWRTWLSAPVAALTVVSADPVSFPIVSQASLVAFQEFLHYVLTKYFRRNQAALAAAVGIDVRSLRRTMHPEEGKHTFSLEHCLTLAKALRHHCTASHVLIQADKADLDRLIRDLYGPSKLGPREEALLDAWNEADPSGQDSILLWAQQTAAIAKLKRGQADTPTTPLTPTKPRTRRKPR